jgi:hypothetical protein
MMLACAGLTVAPTATALTVSAAEMAMMVRLIEDCSMFLFPFLAGRLARLLLNLIHEACQAQKTAISFAGPLRRSATLHRFPANIPNRADARMRE